MRTGICAPDISYDHFGFYFAWGSVVLLPTIYTVQIQYLARYPVNLSTMEAHSLLSIGLSGYAIFRLANSPKKISQDERIVVVRSGANRQDTSDADSRQRMARLMSLYCFVQVRMILL